MDDLEIEYNDLAAEKGCLYASLWYVLHVLRAVTEFLIITIYWRISMFKNYLKIAFRNIKRHKVNSIINTSGLAVCMACCILIIIWVQNEFSYDRFHKDNDRIFRIIMNTRSESQDTKSARVSAPLIPIINANYPEVESAARLLAPWSEISIQKDNKAFHEEKVYYADNDIFNILSFTFIIGNPEKALSLPRTMVISENIAQKYFHNENPIGNVLQVNNEVMEVSGVFKNLPDNTHLKCNILISLNTLSYDFDRWWGWAAFYSYIKLRQNVTSERFNSKILHIAQEYTGNRETEYLYYLQPLSEIHFSSGIHQEIESPGNLKNVLLLLFMGLLILVIGCINYINLTIVLFSNREKEVGIRKVAGAERSQLIIQFFIESFLITLFSILLALIIIYLTLPSFNAFADKHFDVLVLISPITIIILFLQTFLVSIIAGSLSVYFISFFKSGIILKAKLRTGFRGTGTQKALISFQFTIAIVLMVSTLVILEQINYMKSENLGFDKKQKLIINVDFNGDYELIKHEFLRHPEINSVAASQSVPGRIEGRFYTNLVGNDDDKKQIMDYLYVDYDYIPLYKIKMLYGRPFEKLISTDNRNAFIINKAATEALGFTSPDKAIGNRICEGGEGIEGIIIGVTDNFHYKGLQNTVDPLVMQIKPERFKMLSLTINTENIQKTLDFIEKKWKELNLGIVFQYFFLDEDFNRHYATEEKMGSVFTLFTFITIFVLCFGVFSLMAHLVKQRTKEIGIRKVLGASVPRILILLSKEFMKLVFIANCFAWPIAYFAMNKWLQNFAYRVDLKIWIFILSGLAALSIALLTVSYQSIKAAMANPIDSLRYE